MSGTNTNAVKGPIHNIDDTTYFNNFYKRETGKTAENLKKYVKNIADSGAKTVLCCVNAQRTSYRSDVWDSCWTGFDVNADENQPFLRNMKSGERKRYFNRLKTMEELDRDGFDYPACFLKFVREAGMSAWLTVRMNDIHFADQPEHPFHSSFQKEHPEYVRINKAGYFERALDYARHEVREYYLKLLRELLERYDMDGIELDFMREAFLFQPGKEGAGGIILDKWLKDEVIPLFDAASKRLGHPVKIGIRVPSRPETAKALGFNVENWLKSGFPDLLVFSPRWFSLEFDMPVDEWKQLVKNYPKTTIAGGVEISYAPYEDERLFRQVDPELFRGAASLITGHGAELYLFNYFQYKDPKQGWLADSYKSVLKDASSTEEILKKPHTFAITFRDIRAPGEKYNPQLPLKARNGKLVFNIMEIKKTDKVMLQLGIPSDKPQIYPSVKFGGAKCVFKERVPSKFNGHDMLVYEVQNENGFKTGHIDAEFVWENEGDTPRIKIAEIHILPE